MINIWNQWRFGTPSAKRNPAHRICYMTAMSGRERETILDYLNTIYEENIKLLLDKDKKANIIDGITE